MQAVFMWAGSLVLLIRPQKADEEVQSRQVWPVGCVEMLLQQTYSTKPPTDPLTWTYPHAGAARTPSPHFLWGCGGGARDIFVKSH